ncbi:MAG: extracellular solute-binding protein [Clostridia bacterium]|nr:extracellular solute-binding protein [Clostridia bacterium]
MKIISILLALITVLAVFTGCHGAKTAPAFEIPQSFDESKNYEITFWAKNDTNLTQVEIYHNTIADFEALYPNIKVNLRLYTDYGKIYNDVITNLATDTTPNVCITYPDHIATYLSGKNTVVALEELMKNSDYGLGGKKVKFDSPKTEEIVPQFLNEGKIGGVQYALPYMRSTEACYVNKTYVEKLGFTLPETLTWDFIWEVSEAATEKNADETYKVNGQKVMIPCIYKSTDNMMIQMLAQLDAPYSGNKGEIGLFNDTTKELLDEIAIHAGTGAFSTFKISSYPANFLNAGQCIFAIDSTAGATWMGSDAPLVDIAEEALVNFETEVMTVPQFDTNNPKMISQGPSVCIFNKKDTGEVLASWLFAQFLLTNRVQIDYSCTEGYLPVTKKAQESEEYQSYLSKKGSDNDMHYRVKIEAAELLMNNIDNTFVTPVFNGSASLRNAAGALIESVTKAKRRNQKVDEQFYNELFSETNSLYRLDQIEAAKEGSAQVKASLGKLPFASIALITTLSVIWVGIAVYVLISKIKRK